MTRPMHQVTIGHSKVWVPLVDNPKTTQDIADKVSQRLAAIEEESERINTQAFALRAAFEYAAEVSQLEAQQDSDTKQLITALDRIATTLRRLVETFPYQPT